MARRKIVETEDDVKKLIIAALKQHDAWQYAPIQTGMGVHGIPDRIACVPIVVTGAMVGSTVGLFVAIEAKRPGRRTEPRAGATPAQFNHLCDILDAGGIAMLADSEEDTTTFHGLFEKIKHGLVAFEHIRQAFKILLHKRTTKNG